MELTPELNEWIVWVLLQDSLSKVQEITIKLTGDELRDRDRRGHHHLRELDVEKIDEIVGGGRFRSLNRFTVWGPELRFGAGGWVMKQRMPICVANRILLVLTSRCGTSYGHLSLM
jgi:hypothetical protein